MTRFVVLLFKLLETNYMYFDFRAEWLLIKLTLSKAMMCPNGFCNREKINWLFY